MSAIVDLRIRTSKTDAEKEFKYSALSFPDITDRLSDQIIEQMMVDGSVTSTLRIALKDINYKASFQPSNTFM
jgi:hypothetical protein